MLHADAQGLLTYVRHPGFGYVHNPYEVEQVLRLATGATKRPPRELSSLMSILKWRTITPTSFAETCGSGDALIVELSSIRVMKYRNNYLQLHRLRELLKENGMRSVNAAFFDDRESARSYLRRIAVNMPDGLARSVLEELEFWEMTESELLASIQRIYQATTLRLSFVNIVTTTNTANGIRQREMLRDVISTFVRGHERAIQIDPTEWVDKAGWENVMQDSSHYAPHYEPELGRLLAHATIKSLPH